MSARSLRGRFDAGCAAEHLNRAVLATTLLLAVPAALALVWVAASNDRLLAASVYGASLVACSFFSFAYHTFSASRLRPLLRRLDHSAIFLLIAGTYTPFGAMLVNEHEAGLFAAVWAVAVAGVVLKLAVGARWHGFFVAAYVALGWLGLADLAGLVRTLSPQVLFLLAVGGGAFSVGALVHWRARGAWAEPLWHMLVLVGCSVHFAAVAAVV